MFPVKLAIIYYSTTGTIYQLARAMQEAALEVGAEVRLRKVRELATDASIDRKPDWRAHVDATRHIPEVSHDDLTWADAYLFGSPTRFGNVAAPFKQFVDSTGGLWAQGLLANKVAAGFTSADNPHGGQETTLLAMYNMLYHWGTIIVPPGYTDEAVFGAGGNPYGISTTATREELPVEIVAGARYMARRVVLVTRMLVAGREYAHDTADVADALLAA